MSFNFNELTGKMPAGLLVTDVLLETLFINQYARKQIFLLKPGQDSGSVMLHHRFYTTDRQLFDMKGCMQNMISGQHRSFQKTLIIGRDQGDALVYLTATAFGMEGSDYYLFLIADLSGEMDCITHAPGSFNRHDFILGQRIIGHDEKIRNVYRLISLAADSMVNVMITGESGTGKELVADAFHALSARRDNPLVKINCSALSESLLESELFGHVKGAFTGAIKDKPGKFEEARGGTLFLDEIGEISHSLQVKLLRVIQEKTIERVGDNRSIPVDMRIIAATNKDLRDLISQEGFREDLYYRLNVFSVHMPPLRERALDIPLLCDHFMHHINHETGKQIKGFSRSAIRLLMKYSWPGNIRELRNAIEYAFVLVRGNLIDVDDLPENIRKDSGGKHPRKESSTGHLNTQDSGFVKSRGGRLNISREALLAVLESNAWNQSQAARVLGISRVALWKKIKKFGL